MNTKELFVDSKTESLDIKVRQPNISCTKEVIGPEIWCNRAQEAASIMIRILSANYGNHNLTNNQNKLIESINDGSLMPFISPNFDACAALIKVGESDVEIGRAACLPEVTGGKSGPIVAAVEAWKNQEVFPFSQILRAEVRVAKPTKEVPGGQSTQSICLKKDKLGLNPTAIGPFFHHGNPDRQEMFMLASKTKNPDVFKKIANEVFIPSIIFQQEIDQKIFLEMWLSNFETLPKIVSEINSIEPIELEVKEAGPLIVVSKTKLSTGESWKEKVTEKLNNGTRFAVAKIALGGDELLPTNAATFKELQSEGFRLIGFEPVVENGKNSIEILMGKLSLEGKKRLVLPCFIEDFFSHELEDMLIQNSIQWRKQ